jgi:hypothetical protein
MLPRACGTMKRHGPLHTTLPAAHHRTVSRRAARGHLQHPQGRARRGPAQAAGDPQPGPGHRGAGRRPGVPAGSAGCSTSGMRSASTAPPSAGPTRGRPSSWRPGYDVAYRTNAVTRHGEHGNALLARWPMGDVGHHDVSDHRFEQRGLLHVPVQWNGVTVHAVVAHFGLVHASRVRQVQRLADFIAREVPPARRWWWPATSTTGTKARRADGRDRPAACLAAGGAKRADLSVADAGVRARPLLPARPACRSTMVPRGMRLGAHVRPPAAGGRAGARLIHGMVDGAG